MAIPKKIHWCWLSGDPLAAKIQECIDSWRRIMPDYEIILWDKQRFDIHRLKWVEDACNLRKWAFAADYIRLYALYTEGGIYLDSDVMVFRRFDKFLHHAAFSSVEYLHNLFIQRNESNPYAGYGIQAAIIGSEKGNTWIKACMDSYHNKECRLKENGDIDYDVSPVVLAYHAHKLLGFQYDIPFQTPQYLKNNIVIYPPKVFASLFSEINMQTYAIHIWQGSWANENIKKPSKAVLAIKEFYKRICGQYRFFAMLHYKRKNLFNQQYQIK
jgi:mannosyltransferase OCH1-like enzyme